MRLARCCAVAGCLLSAPALALQCGPYLLEGETIKKIRKDGEIEIHRSHLPLPQALSIHSGDIIAIRVTGLPPADGLRLEWKTTDGRVLATEKARVDRRMTQQYSLPAGFDDYVPAGARMLTISVSAGRRLRCSVDVALRPGD